MQQMTLQEFRQYYPMYNDMPDQQVLSNMQRSGILKQAETPQAAQAPDVNPVIAAARGISNYPRKITHGILQPLLESDSLNNAFPDLNLREKSKAFALQKDQEFAEAEAAHPVITNLYNTSGMVGMGMLAPFLGKSQAANQGVQKAWQFGKNVFGNAAINAGYGAAEYVPEGGSREWNAVSSAVLGEVFPRSFQGAEWLANKINKPMDWIGKQVMAGINNVDDTIVRKGAGHRVGVTLRPAEASGSSLAGATQGQLGVSKEGASYLQEKDLQRMAQEKKSIADTLVLISKDSKPAQEEVRAAAGQFISKKRQKMQAAADPYYKKSEPDLLPDSEFAKLNNKEGFKNYLEIVKKDPLLKDEIAGFPDNSVKVLDFVKKQMDADINRLQGEEGIKSNRAAIVKTRKKELTGLLDQYSPDYKKARQIYGDDARPLKIIEESQLGKIAEMDDNQVKNVAKVIFDPGQTDIRVMRKLKGRIRKENPEAWNRIVRNWIEGGLDSTDGSASSYYNKYLKSDRKFEQLMVAVEDIPGAQQRLSDQREAFKYLIKPVTPRAAAKLSATGMMDKRNFGDFLKKQAANVIGAKYDKAAVELLTSDNWDEQLRQIRKIKDPVSRAQAYGQLLGRVTAQGTAATNNEVFDKREKEK